MKKIYFLEKKIAQVWAVTLISKSNEMLFQKVQQRYTPLINTIYFRSFIIDQSWNTLQLKNIVLSFHPPFEPITALFTITGLW